MKVILKETVKNVGSVGQILSVSPGYARNYLIPNKMAVVADEGNTNAIEDYKKALAKKMEEEKAKAESVKSQLEGKVITVEKKVGGSGKLFGTVTAAELSQELEKEGIEVEKRLIVIERPIKQLGTFEIKTSLFAGVEATFQVKVEKDAKQIAEEAKKAKTKKKEKKVEAEAEKVEETEENPENSAE